MTETLICSFPVICHFYPLRGRSYILTLIYNKSLNSHNIPVRQGSLYSSYKKETLIWRYFYSLTPHYVLRGLQLLTRHTPTVAPTVDGGACTSSFDHNWKFTYTKFNTKISIYQQWNRDHLFPILFCFYSGYPQLWQRRPTPSGISLQQDYILKDCSSHEMYPEDTE